MDNGYIKIHRKLLNWEWYDDLITFKVFIHCIFKANWKDAKFHGHVIPRGSFVTSIKKMSEDLSGKGQANKITTQNIRTALNHLKLTHELTIKTTSKFSIITVNNYDLYQDANKQLNKELTNNQQTTNKQLTTIEESNKVINKEYNNIEKNYTKKEKHKYGIYSHVLLSDDEHQKLVCAFSNYQELIDYLDEYIEMKGYKAKNHYLAIRKWVVNAVEEQRIRNERLEKNKNDKLPSWFDKENEKEELTDDERREIEAIKNGTYAA